MDCAWRSISHKSVWNSPFRAFRSPVKAPDGDCVASGHALGQLGHAAAEFVGDRQTSGVVAGLVDPVTGSQLLNRLALERVIHVHVLLSDEGVYVGLDGDRHCEILSVFCAGILPDTNLIGGGGEN